jgi:hypothetical protein
MVNFFRCLARIGAVLLLSAAAFFASGSAYATCQIPAHWSPTTTYNTGAVVAYDVMSSSGTLISGAFYQSLVDNNTGFAPASSPSQWNGNNILVCNLTVQPIDVCSSTGTSCPLINSLGQTAASNPGTNVIGTIDPLTGLSLDTLAFGQIGVGLAFRSVVLYKSPANPNTTNKFTEPGYGWLHACSCNTGSSTSCPSINSCSSGSSSVDLLTLTQQGSISQGVAPKAPLNSLQTVPNLAFVHVIHPVTAGTIIKGYSWPGNNGGAIASDSVFPAFSPGTVAHELGHIVGPPLVDGHTDLGAGPVMCPAPYPDPKSECTENLMTAGSAVRQLPNGLNNCGPMMNQACWVTQVPPEDTMPPLALDLLTTGGAGLCTTATISTCQSQQAAFLLSNFMNTVTNTVSTVSSGSGTASTAAVAATKNSGTAAPAQSSASSPLPCPSTAAGPCFFVAGVSGSETLLAYIVMVAQPPSGSPQFTFSSNPFKILKESRTNLLQDFDEQPLDSDVPYPCAAADVLCGEVEFNRNKGQGFGPNDFMQFSLNIQKGSTPATLADLCGAKVAFLYSSGYASTSVLGPTPCSGSSSLTATSLSQDPMTPPQVVTVSTAPTSTPTPGCTLLPNGKCSNPMTSGTTDTNPTTGLEGGAICYSGGVPIQCPF